MITVIEALSSGSLSSAINKLDPEVWVTVASSLTLSVSSTATGASFTPVTVIVKVAVLVCAPSERV